MGRVLAIDYGLKRVGIAVTDPLQIIATALTTVRNIDIFDFLKEYLSNEEVELFVVGMPKNLQNKDTNATQPVRSFIVKLKKQFPDKEIKLIDERFTSKMAFATMIASGVKKQARRNKETVDKISATIILQSYLEQAV